MLEIEYKENETLRNESMEYLYKKEEVRKFTITTTIAVLTLVNSEIWKNTPTLYLIPAIIIIFGIINTLGMETRIKDITTYRIVFLENEDNEVRWARAVTKYDMAYTKKNDIAGFLRKFDYVVLLLLCLILYTNKFWGDITQLVSDKSFFSSSVLIFVLLIILFIYTIYLSVKRYLLDSQKHFEKCINRWKTIKENGLEF